MSKTYTTIQGDMWDSIAFSQLGSEAYTDRLMNLNPQHLGYYTFPAGIVLKLPDPAEDVGDALPPGSQWSDEPPGSSPPRPGADIFPGRGHHRQYAPLFPVGHLHRQGGGRH